MEVEYITDDFGTQIHTNNLIYMVNQKTYEIGFEPDIVNILRLADVPIKKTTSNGWWIIYADIKR